MAKGKFKCKNFRKKIPERFRLKLWVKSAGICQFMGCPKRLWRDDLTLSEANFADVAHIIGASKQGPRGSEKSIESQSEYSNLMLLCKVHHKLIDDDEFEKDFPTSSLRLKEEQEARIEILTSKFQEIHKSTVLQCNINIKDRFTPINEEATRKAMFAIKKYPKARGIKIEDMDFNIFGKPGYWLDFAESKIKRRIEKELSEGADDEKIKSLSIFAIAPIPLLMYLGKCIGDTVAANLFQSHRDIHDPSRTWTWRKNNPKNFNYIVSELANKEGKKVLLKIALSDFIAEDKYSTLLDENTSVYEISISEPSTNFLKHPTQIESFRDHYRKLLNLIQSRHGNDCNISILSAIPCPIAIECGRALLPTKDPEISAYNYYAETGEFKNVLRIN